MKTASFDPNDLRLHWTRKLLPAPTKDVVDGISDSIARGDKLPPGYLVEPNFVVCGEARRLAHKAQQRDMEFYVISEEEALRVVLVENTNRRHYRFKYQLAWDYCPLATKVVEYALRRRSENVKNRQNAGKSPDSAEMHHREALPLNMDEMADRIGVSRRLFFEVMDVYRRALKWDDENEPRCFGESDEEMTAVQFISAKVSDPEDPCTPGQAWAGIKGSLATRDQDLNKPSQLELFTGAVDKLVSRFEYWQAFDASERRAALKEIRELTIEKFPPESCSDLADFLTTLAKEARDRAKEVVK